MEMKKTIRNGLLFGLGTVMLTRESIEKIYKKKFNPKKITKSLEANLLYLFEFFGKLSNITRNITNMLESGRIDVNMNMNDEIKHVFRKTG